MRSQTTCPVATHASPRLQSLARLGNVVGSITANPAIVRTLGADLRSLAALRIALALVVLIDLFGRVSNLGVHYADGGVLPRDVLLDGFNRWRWSLLFLNGTVGFLFLLFVLTACAAILMLLGYRTRLMTVIVWVMIVSIQTRNPFVLSAADTLLRLLLFWAMLLPLGARWSIDALRAGRSYPRTSYALSWATVGILMQIAFMYWFTAILKDGGEWRSDWSALYYALGAKHLTRPLGDLIYPWEPVLQALTFGSIVLEILAPILVFIPWKTGPIRTAVIVSVIGFHIGILLTMDLGIFPWLNILSMSVFLPAWFWNRTDPAFHRLASRIPSGSALRQIPDRVRQVADAPDTGSARRPARGIRLLRAHPVINVLAALSLVLVLLWNVASVSSYTIPSRLSPVVYSVGLYQRWNMFAPRPPRGTIWYVYQGRLVDGTELDMLPTIVRNDLNHIQPVSFEEPQRIASNAYGDKYWRKYLTEIASGDRNEERLAFAAYICRTWNNHYAGDVELENVKVFRLDRPTLPDYEDADIRQREIGSYTCT